MMFGTLFWVKLVYWIYTSHVVINTTEICNERTNLFIWLLRSWNHSGAGQNGCNSCQLLPLVLCHVDTSLIMPFDHLSCSPQTGSARSLVLHSEHHEYLTRIMHDAYEEKPILEKLPLQIESIACHGKYQNIFCTLFFRHFQAWNFIFERIRTLDSTLVYLISRWWVWVPVVTLVLKQDT